MLSPMEQQEFWKLVKQIGRNLRKARQDRKKSQEQMSELIAEGFGQAEQEIFRSLRNLSEAERLAVLKTLDALHIVQKQLDILLQIEETSK